MTESKVLTGETRSGPFDAELAWSDPPGHASPGHHQRAADQAGTGVEGEADRKRNREATTVQVVGEGARPPSPVNAMLAEIRCILQTLVLVATGKIGMPREEVGRMIVFADGSASRIYRETTLRTEGSSDAVLLVVRFRLKLIGRNRLAHALFRFESLFNTVLFAAHRGFRTKLWLTDTTTGFYRGIYEWEGSDAAVHYAEVLRVVLASWVEAGSFGYRVIEGTHRDRFLDGRVDAEEVDDSGALWWLPMERTGNGKRSIP